MILQVKEKELGETIKEKCEVVYNFLQDLFPCGKEFFIHGETDRSH